MRNVLKGDLFKEWFLKTPQIRRVLEETHNSFHIVNLDEIDDDGYYLVTNRYNSEVLIEAVELCNDLEEEWII